MNIALILLVAFISFVAGFRLAQNGVVEAARTGKRIAIGNALYKVMKDEGDE